MANVFCLVAIALACLMVVFATPLPKPHVERKYNKFVQLMLSKLVDVRYYAEQFLIKENAVKAPSPDYP
jgi:hypothetical protein